MFRLFRRQRRWREPGLRVHFQNDQPIKSLAFVPTEIRAR